MSPFQPAQVLGAILAPPGRGIFSFSTGRAQLEARAARYLAWRGSIEELDAGWPARLAATLAQRPAVALLAIPSDTGAGIVRGAAWGPDAIRGALGTAPVPDLGDVRTVPQLLTDAMCSEAQRAQTRAALYGALDPALASVLPVAPIDLGTRAYRALRAASPDTRVMLLGGDHTVSWAALDAILADDPSANADVAIVHFDAHTDLLPHRLGVQHCFATWAYHANERLGRGGRLLQLGIRASARPRAHWEGSLGVRQLWADECASLRPVELAARVVDHLERIGARRVYVTNDLDGTDRYWAAACGTPEPGGLDPEQVLAIYEALEGRFEPLGADVVELAPGLSLDPKAAARSTETARAYVVAGLRWLARAPTLAGAEAASPAGLA